MKTTHFKIVSLAAALALVASPLLASAQNVSVTAQTSATTTVKMTKAQTAAAARLQKVIDRSNTAITARLSDLAKLNVRIADMKNVSATEKAAISNDVQTNITGLNALQAKIDADTTEADALADEKTITGSFRIYALVIPQGYIAAASDRVNTIVGMMNTVSGKLQTRITALQGTGKDVTALQAALTDFNAKTLDANTQAQTAQSSVANLVPDQHNATVLASNTAALKAARADIKTATADLKAARKDADTIMKGVKTQ